MIAQIWKSYCQEPFKSYSATPEEKIRQTAKKPFDELFKGILTSIFRGTAKHVTEECLVDKNGSYAVLFVIRSKHIFGHYDVLDHAIVLVLTRPVNDDNAIKLHIAEGNCSGKRRLTSLVH